MIKRRGSWERYYSQWGAYTLELDLLAGAGTATRFAGRQRPFGTWMYTAECDGAAFVDHDEHRLLWFSKFLGAVAYRDAVLDVMARTWPGWRIDWAYGGLPEIRRALDDEDGLNPQAAYDHTHTLDHTHDHAHTYGLNPGSEERPPCLLTVVVGGRVRAYMVAEGACAVIRHDLDSLMRYCREWTPVRVWPCLPSSGVHLDVDHRIGAAWSLGLIEARGPNWPGWWWEHWRDRCREHFDRIGGAIDLPVIDRLAGVRRLTEEFERHQELDAGTHMAAQLLDFIGALKGAAESLGYVVQTETDNALTHRPMDLTEEERDRVHAALAALTHTL